MALPVLTVSRVCLQFVVEVFPDHTHLLFLLKVFECPMRTTEIVSEYDQEIVMKSHTAKAFSRSGRCAGYLCELLNWQICHCVVLSCSGKFVLLPSSLV